MGDTNDRELLELAAKAAGIEGPYYESDNPIHTGIYRAQHSYYWNPLISDSEAMRLAVQLGLQIRHYPIYDTPRWAVLVVDKKWNSDAERDVSDEELVRYGDDPCAATRRAIVRAAAAIGKEMP